ncbi:MAG: PHP domain-containing protein [Acholeplasmataceae bacterium]|nr:PHP domain-containing protein [Acholeplasmataceae bacterium]
MKYYYDLHIHTVLSPCADVLMTPNNIFNMANLKGLNIIAVTDHNSLKQISVCSELSKSYDMLFIPGVEITVNENFHVLCYFKTVDEALKFDHILESHLPKIAYDIDFYGEQQIVNIDDEVIDMYPYLLSSPTQLSISKLKEILIDYDCLLFYAHLDRSTHSGSMWFKNYPLDGIELTKNVDNDFIRKQKIDEMIIHNSDAHQIIDISEKSQANVIELNNLTIDDFFRYFKHG